MSPSLLKTITEKVLNISSIFEYWIDFFYTKLDIKSFNRILQEQIIAERIKHSLPLRQTIITLQQKVIVKLIKFLENVKLMIYKKFYRSKII